MVEGSDKPAENQPSPGQNPAIENAAAQAYTPKDITAEQHARSARVRTDEQSVNEVMSQSQQGGTADSQAVGQQIVSKISPETADAYVRGQQLQASGRVLTDRSLSHDDREALSTYHNLHSQMETENSSYSGSRSLTQIVEDGIKSKQAQYEHQPAGSANDSTRTAAGSRAESTSDDRSSAGQKTEQQSQSQSTPGWLVKGQEKNPLFGDDSRPAQKATKVGDAQTADRSSSDQQQRTAPADAGAHDGPRGTNRPATDQNQSNQNARDTQQTRQTDASRQQDQQAISRRSDLRGNDDQRQPNQGQLNRNQDQHPASSSDQQRSPTRESDVKQSGTGTPRDSVTRSNEAQSQQQSSGRVTAQDGRAGAGNKISATEDQRAIVSRDNPRGVSQTPDKQNTAERSSLQSRVSGDAISQQPDTGRQTEQSATSERKIQETVAASDRRTISNPIAAGKDSTQQVAARELQRVAANDTGQARSAVLLSERTVSLLRQSAVDARSIQPAAKGTVTDTRAADIKALSSAPGGITSGASKGSLEIARQIRAENVVLSLTLRATQTIVRTPETGRPVVQAGGTTDGRAVAPSRTGDARTGTRADAGARPGVIAPGARIPGSTSSGVEPARTFTSTARITERSADRRYILGTEIALAAVIAAAGTARQRADATARGGAASEVKGGLRPADAKPTDGRAPNLRSNDAAASRTTDARTGAPRPAEGRSIIPGQRPDTPRLPADRTALPDGKRIGRSDSPGDKRFITGAEIALAAVIASAGTSRVRGEKTPESKANQDTTRGQKHDVRPGEPVKQETKPGKHDTGPDKQDTKTGRPDTTAGKHESNLGTTSGRREESNPRNPDTIQDSYRGGRVAEPAKDERSGIDSNIPAADQDSATDSQAVNPEAASKKGLHSLPELIIQADEVDPGKVNKSADLAARAREDMAEELSREGSAAPAARLFQRPTVLISRNETLVSLAEAYFHDPNLAWLIADLNKDQIAESWIDGKRVVELKSRQLVSLPVWDDITEFYENRPPDSHPENIITIVQQTQVDVELLNSRLGVAMGVPAGAQPNVVPAFQAQQLAAALPLSQRSVFSRFLTRPRIADG